MKINMRMRYLKIGNLDEEELQKVWCVLRDIKETLAIRYPSNSISVSLHLENCDISPVKVNEILKEFQGKGILKILKRGESDKSLNSIPIRVNKKRVNSEYKEVEDRVKKERKPVVSISFDKKLCTLKYGDKQYKPQRKGGRCQILKTLWEGRRIITIDGKIKKEGQYFEIDELGLRAGFTKSIDRSVRDAIQDLRDKFNEMRAPIEIIAQNGYMLVVKE